MRTAKWILIIAGSVLLLVAAIALIMTSVDPNRYRGKVEHIVADLVGRPLIIEGNLQITWFPWLGVRIGPAHLSDTPYGPTSVQPGNSAHLPAPPDHPGPAIAEWQSLTVAAKVLPLLQGQIVIDRIRLQSPHIHLRRDALGHGNWEGLGPRPSSASAGKKSPQVAGVEIRDGVLDYVDETNGRQVTLSGLDLDVGEWRTGQSLPVRTRFLVHSDSLPPDGVWVQLDAPALNVRVEPLSLAAPKVSVRVADARIDGALNYGQTADAQVSGHGSVAVHAPSIRKLAGDFGLNQTLPHDPTALGALELNADWSYDNGILAVKPLVLKLDGVNFNGWVERRPPPQSAWGFELHGDRIDLGRYVDVDSTNKKPFELPVELLRAINANGNVIFDEAVIAGTRMSDVRLRFKTAESRQ